MAETFTTEFAGMSSSRLIQFDGHIVPFLLLSSVIPAPLKFFSACEMVMRLEHR